MEISCTLGIENRKEAKCMGADNRGTHLTKEERKIIAKGIESGATKTAIGRTIGKDNSTVGKEIKQHLKLVSKCPLPL